MFIVTADRTASIQVALSVMGTPGGNPPTWDAVWSNTGGQILGQFNDVNFATGFTIPVADMAAIAILSLICTPNDASLDGASMKAGFAPTPVITPGGNPITQQIQGQTSVMCFFTP